MFTFLLILWKVIYVCAHSNLAHQWQQMSLVLACFVMWHTKLSHPKVPVKSEKRKIGCERLDGGLYHYYLQIHLLYKIFYRYAHLDGDTKEVSPVMDQFLECVWQLMQQFPCAFEFNERFLIQLHTHIYSCQYGNFIGICQKERRDLR